MGRAANFIKEYARMLAAKAEQSGAKDERPPFHPPIVFSREYGSGGQLVATAVAEQLHYKFVDKEILEEIAGRSHVAPDLVAIFDEKKISALELLGAGFLRGETLYHEEFDRYLKMAIRGVLQLGSVVILGRGAVLLAEPGKALRVRVSAPRELRVQRIMQRLGMSEKEARTKLQQVEVERKSFHQRVYGKDEVPSRYDLGISTEIYGIDDSVQLVLNAYQLFCRKSGDELQPVGEVSQATLSAISR